jgi:two-component system LytT family response regulator
MHQCIIIDDDDFALYTLADKLKAFPDFQLVKTIKDSTLGIKYIMTLKPDVVFLDINMPGKGGLEVMNEINELEIPTHVIFTTSYNEYIMDAFRNKAFDYLIKPIGHQELEEALERIKAEPARSDRNSERPPRNRISFRNAHGTVLMETSDILYVQAEGSYSNIYDTNHKPVVICKNIGKIQEEFPSDMFFKISRSAIINMHHISRIDRPKRVVTLNCCKGDSVSLKASKERLYDLERAINRLS